MVKVKPVIIALLVVVIGVMVAKHVFQSEEKRVKKQFSRLSKWTSKEAGENTFTMAQKMKEIGALFAEKCEFKADTISFSGLYNREDISSYAARARLPFIDLSLHFYDLDVSFPEKEVAKVTATAKLTGKLSTGECVDETHEFVSVLKKVEKRWLLTNLEVIEVLKK
jgi:hypothetical protein